MSEKATIFQTVQVGVESTPGTPVAANRKLTAVSIVPTVRTEADAFRGLGNKYASMAVLNKEWTEASIDGKLTYNEILYLLSSLISQPTPIQQGTTAAYKWTFVSSTSSSDTGKTFTVEQGDSVTAWRAAGVRVAGLEITFNRNEVAVSGSALGEQIETGITLTPSPTELAPLPVLPAHLSLYTALTQSGLNSASPMTRGFSVVWRLTDKIGLAWPIGQDPVAVETAPTLEATLSVATDTDGFAYLSAMRSGDTRWFRVKAVGKLIEDTYYHTFQLDFPAQVREVGEFSDQDGLYLVEYTLQGIHDSSWGKSFEINVTTNVSAL